jgi:hypothetical protein
MRAMFQKDKAAQQAAVDEYFKHWDNKSAETETEETRKVGTHQQFRGPEPLKPLKHTRLSNTQPPRPVATNMPRSRATTTTWPRICTSTAGASRSTSAASRTASPSTRPLRATSTTSPTWPASRRTCAFWTSAAVSAAPRARSASSRAPTSSA